MMRKKYVYVTGFALFFSVFIAFFYQSLGVDKTPRHSAQMYQQLPAFSAKLLHSSRTFHSSELKDKYTIINVWATWCQTCLYEHAFWVHQAKRPHGYRLVGLNYRDNNSEAKDYLETAGNPYEMVIADDRGHAAITLGVRATPQTFLFAPDGTLLYKHIGAVNDKIWAAQFAPRIKLS